VNNEFQVFGLTGLRMDKMLGGKAPFTRHTAKSRRCRKDEPSYAPVQIKGISISIRCQNTSVRLNPYSINR